MKAINICWDADYDTIKELPQEIELPQGMTDMDEIENYISNVTGFCHFGFMVSD